MTSRILATTLVLCAATAPARAQSSDQLYRSWSWQGFPGSPRTLGLAGAGSALGDDATALVANPASMTTLKKSELALAALGVGSGTGGRVQDARGSWSGPGYVGGAAILTRRLAAGGYLRQVQGGVLSLASTSVGGSAYTGWLDAQVIEGGAAVAYRVRDRLSAGIRLSASHLQLEGYLRRESGGATTLEAGAAAGETRITASAGVFLEPDRNLRLGLVVEPGCSWTVSRTANDPSRALPLDAGSEYELRQPSRVSSSIAWSAASKLLVVGQADYVRYSEISSALVVRPGASDEPPSAYQSEDALEGRLGLEVSLPVMSRVSAQLRFGVASIAGGGLSYVGANAGEVAAWGNTADRRELAAAGASVVMRSWRFDVAAMFGHTQPVLAAGVRLRY